MSAVGPKGALFPSAYRVDAAVLPCRILKRGTDVDHVVHATAAAVAVGISEEAQPTVGKPVRVAHRPGELVRVEAGAAFAIDIELASNASGQAITAVSTNPYIAISRGAATAAGDLVTCEIRYGVK